MSITVGYVKTDTQINVLDLNFDDQTIIQKTVDAIELKDINFQLLITNEKESLEELEESFGQEKRFYPIVSDSQFGITDEQFASLGFEELTKLYDQVNSRWVLGNNIQTIEQLYSVVTYLKDLWVNDRNAFFEELWFIMKTNLATSELTMIYHDVDSNDDNEKAKPQLINSLITGTKIPNITICEDAHDKLMEDYKPHFSEVFQVTEFSVQKSQIVATAHIDLSPILIMGNTNSINQLQNSILVSIFSGLQTEN